MSAVCMYHFWQNKNKTQWLTNQLRGNIIPLKYVKRFPALCCSCVADAYNPYRYRPSRVQADGAFDDLTDSQLKGSLTFLEDYVEEQVEQTEPVEAIRTFLKIIKKRYPWFIENPRSSFYRLLYLLQRCIQKDFTFLEPPDTVDEIEVLKKEDVEDKFELPGFQPENIGRLVGLRGVDIQHFRKKYKCYVKVEKVTEGKETRVYATVKTKVTSHDAFLKIKAELLATAMEVQRKQEDYEKRKRSGQFTSSVLVKDTETSGTSNNDLSEKIPGQLQPMKVEERQIETKSPASVKVPNPIQSSEISSTQKTNLTVSKPQTTMKDTCLVHNRRWLPTYQYLLNQMHERGRLPRKDGRRFSQLVCVCDGDQPSYRRYFKNLLGFEESFKSAVATLKTWKESEIIVQPIIFQLEKAEPDFSAIKFVYYLENCLGGDLSCLKPDHQLPGPAIQPEITTTTASMPVFSAGAGISITASPQIPTASVSASKTPPSTSSLSSSLPVSPNVTQTLPQPVGTLAAVVEKSKFQAKKVGRDDRSPDCFLHGKSRCMFQCILNELYVRNGLPTSFKHAFSQLICTCGETTEKRKYYQDDKTLDEDAAYMLAWMNPARSEKLIALKPLISTIEDCRKSKAYSGNLIRLIYHFRQAETKSYTEFSDVFNATKTTKSRRHRRKLLV